MTARTFTILLVDSCVDNRITYYSHLLQDNQHTYRIVEAESGEQMLELCLSQFPDVILLDDCLPDMNTPLILSKLKTARGMDFLPVLVLVNPGNEEVAVQAIASGATDFLIKENITPDSLRLTIQIVIERTHQLSRVVEERMIQLEQANQELQVTLEELKSAEEELRYQNEQLAYANEMIEQEHHRYQDLFEFAPDGYLVTDVLGNIEEANHAAATLLCINKKHLIGKPLMVFLPQQERNTFRTQLAQLQQVQYWEVNLKPRQGKPFPTMVTVTSNNDSRSQQVKLRWLFRDISVRKQMEKGLQAARDDLEKRVEERTAELSQSNMLLQKEIHAHKKAEAALRESEQRLEAIINNSAAVIYLKDTQGRYLLVNSQYEKLFHVTNEQVQGKTDDEIFSQPVAEVLWENDHTVLETQTSLTFEESVPLDDGLHTYIVIKFPLLKPGGEPYAVCGILTDITEQKQLEAQFLRVQRLESLGTLASGIAHDFNNILTPMLTISQLLSLKLSFLDEEDRQLLKMLEDCSKRGAAQVQQILSFTRGIEGKRVTLEVNNLLMEVEQIAKNTFPKSIQINNNTPTSNLWQVFADSTQLHQVLLNLCVNARDAMPNGGILSMAAENCCIDENYAKMNIEAKVGSYVVITVSDTGCGIPKENLERIFEPFFTTKETGKGTGLGLSTVLGIVKNHGGFVEVYSEVGKGSEFKVYLPTSGTLETLKDSDAEMPTGNGELILIVDDETNILETTKTFLEKYNYKVLTASEGIEAVSLYAQYKDSISLVLMDIQMPSMNGVNAIQILQQINPAVKVIANSGVLSKHELLEAKRAKVKAFLSKPYTIKQLLDTMKSVLTGS
jgi:two-component system, cell cycle sensor histidine kinase and response regulator CckA